MTPLLDVRNFRVSFNGVDVVHSIGFGLQEGEKLALVGESGSGKTVTALSLLKLVHNAQVQGEAHFAGRDLMRLSERELRGVRGDEIAVIFQEPMSALNPLYPVGEQIAEVLRLKRGMGAAAAWQAAVELLESTGIEEPQRRARAFAHQLSGGQRQRVMIAMALASRPRLLIADEPTTALDVGLRAQMLELLARVQREQGMAVILITHDLSLVRRFADRVVVMEKGHVVEQGDVAQVLGDPQHPYTRQLLDSRAPRDVVEPTPDAPVRLRACSLGVCYPVPRPGWRGWFRKGHFRALDGVSFELRQGATLGVVGESGSGKSTLALAALGLVASDGALDVAGSTWASARQLRQERALRRVVQVVFQDPFSSLSPRMTVEQIVGEGLSIHEPALTPAQRRERVKAALVDVGLAQEPAQSEPWLQRYPHEFSGGQRQRLAIARALIVNPEVLILDEPTSALDVSVQRQVLALLQRLQRERGLSYLLITHDMDVVRAMAHEVIVLRSGRAVEQGRLVELFRDAKHPYTQSLIQASADSARIA